MSLQAKQQGYMMTRQASCTKVSLPHHWVRIQIRSAFLGREKRRRATQGMHRMNSNSFLYLPYKVKTQYVHTIADTSIKHTISLQSTPMLKRSIYTCLT